VGSARPAAETRISGHAGPEGVCQVQAPERRVQTARHASGAFRGYGARMQGHLASAKQVDMPDLSGLCGRAVATMALRNWLTGHGLEGKPARSILKRFVDLSDRSCREYESARTCLEAYVARAGNDWGVMLVFEASGHLEQAVTALHKSARHAEALKRMPGVPKITKQELLSSTEVAEIRRIRDAAEHFDENLLNGLVPEDMAILVAPGPKVFEFSGIEVAYTSLARWITKMLALSERFVEHDPYARQRPTIPEAQG
jgi:hypothetical protein